MARLPPRARRAAAGWVARAAIRLLVHPGFRAPRSWREAVIDSLVRPGSWRDLELVAQDLMWILRGKSAAAALLMQSVEQLSTPIHVVRGELDPVIGEPELRELAGLLPAGELTQLPGIGHCPQIEAPARCAEIALDLLRAARGRGAASG